MRRNFYGMVMAWGTPSMITKLTIAKVNALISSCESLEEVKSSEAGVTDILLDATARARRPARRTSSLCHIDTAACYQTRMSMTESPHVIQAFVLAVRSFTEKEYAARGDSTRSGLYNCIKVPDSLRGQHPVLACMEELFGLAQHLSSNVLLGIYVLQLSALVSHVHRIPPRLVSTAVPNEAERTSYLVALDKAVQEYASSTEGVDEAFSREVLAVFKEIEAGGVSMAQKRVIGRARAYVQTG
ncbi:hypothetical protein B0H13DRAFT_2403160 [Mycena leptocephala]|nr:hypothetical protein B0H13DRAFT_2403160 [Mycena leptocephala]